MTRDVRAALPVMLDLLLAAVLLVLAAGTTPLALAGAAAFVVVRVVALR